MCEWIRNRDLQHKSLRYLAVLALHKDFENSISRRRHRDKLIIINQGCVTKGETTLNQISTIILRNFSFKFLEAINFLEFVFHLWMGCQQMYERHPPFQCQYKIIYNLVNVFQNNEPICSACVQHFNQEFIRYWYYYKLFGTLNCRCQWLCAAIIQQKVNWNEKYIFIDN